MLLMSDRGSIEHTIAHEEGWQNLLGAKAEIMVQTSICLIIR